MQERRLHSELGAQSLGQVRERPLAIDEGKDASGGHEPLLEVAEVRVGVAAASPRSACTERGGAAGSSLVQCRDAAAKAITSRGGAKRGVMRAEPPLVCVQAPRPSIFLTLR